MVHKKNTHANLRYIKVFLFLLSIALLISLSGKAFFSFQNRSFTSSFYTFLVEADKTTVIKVDKERKKIAVLKVESIPGDFDGKSLLQKSIALGIPLDASIKLQKANSTTDIKKDFFSYSSFFGLLFTSDNARVHLNNFDLAKLFFLARSIDEVEEKTVVYQELSRTQSGNQTVIDAVNELFRSIEIINEGTSVEVVNLTSVNGFAGDVSHMLKNGGYNIIFVKNGEKKDKSQIVARIPENETIRSLGRILNIPVVYSPSPAAADVSVYLHEELLK